MEKAIKNIDKLISPKEWREAYAPLTLKRSPSKVKYMKWENAQREAAFFNKENPQFHIWSRIQAEEKNKRFILNGCRIYNRIDYCVSKEPWGTNVKGNDFIEVNTYED